MGRRRQSGWFARAIKVVASISALVAWTSNFVTSVDGARNGVNTPLAPHRDDEVRTLPTQSDFDDVEIISVDTESSPIKKPVVESNCDRFYILVSTIDGKISALDLHNKGSLVWSVEADSQPLYSSSLANMELIRNGRKLRLIPSLDGALYQYDGEKVEAIPMSAEMLLSSTYKLSDDSMIVGSKDLRNFGINLRTGEVQFTCGSEGCSNNQGKTKEEPLDGNNILVVTRSTQVVRSVDIKHGNEKWNFSVGQHQVNLPHSSSRPSEIEEDDDDDDEYIDKTEDSNIPLFTASTDECPMKETVADDIDYEDSLQLIIPEGKVVALSKEDDSEVSWEHKFDSPIAKAWVLRQGKVSPMSLFDGRHVPSLQTFSSDDMENESMPQPLLYIGSHQKLMYIQPSPQMETVLKTYTNRRIGHVIDPNIKVSWRPYLNTACQHLSIAASVRTPIFGGNRQQITRQQQPAEARDKKSSTSLSVWNEDYPFDTGYFLYPEFRDTRFQRRGDVMLIEDLTQRPKDDEEDGGLMETLPASLWLYWKEVVAISVTMSVVVHLMLTKFFNPNRNPATDSSDSAAKESSRNSSNSDGLLVANDSSPLLADRQSSSGEYVSRFASDFDCVSCLGKGGFGVVFEAVNKVDDQHYAIKRTMLPRSEGAKEKVLREVRALAKLEHIGIVRYFNAWVESPPAGWQEERDKQFQFSDMSGPTSYSNTASYSEYQPRDKLQLPDTPAKGAKKAARPGIIEEASLDTDSVIFASEVISDNHQLKQSGSGEFSVHSNLSDSGDRSENSFNNPQSKLFSFGFDPFADPSHSGSHGDSVNNSKSSIPFSNYTSTSSILFSHQTDQELTGDSVVFESNSNMPSRDKAGWESMGTIDDTDSIVFEKSQTPVDKCVNHEHKVTLSQGHSDHHTVDISLSSHKKDNEDDDEEEDRNESSDKVLPGTKFFLYIQMQLYRKETLKDWLSNNTLNRDRHTILDIFDQIVCAVDYVHSQGLMHRDLKPSNIFFTADGVVKVGDFGLVTALSVQQDQGPETGPLSSGRHTAEVGTTLYMSPEQIARKPYDLKIDIFSLGLIFLELWIPFSTQMERIRTLQDAKRQVFPSRFNRELPSESELVHKMTSADPALRPATMDILDHCLFKDLAPTRMGTKNRKRTISDNSNS